MNTMAFHPILGVLTEVFLEPGDHHGVKKVVEIFNTFQKENQMTGSRTLPYIPHVKHYSWKRQKNPFRVSDSDSGAVQFGCITCGWWAALTPAKWNNIGSALF